MTTQDTGDAAVATNGVRLDSVADAVEAIRAGKPVVVVDDEDRENEGDLIFAAQRASAETVGFMIRWTSGYICVAMRGRDLDRLGLPPMTLVNEDKKGTAYAVTVDARDVKATGISAEDRARTIKVLSDSATEPWELTRPGHVVPLRAMEGGVLRGHEVLHSSMRSTYFATTSTSRFTGSPTDLDPSVVSPSVVGMSETVNESRAASTTVSDTPSTVMEPFSTT